MLANGEDFPGSKINALVANVARIWEQAKPTRVTQKISSDMGVHPTPLGFSAYDEVARKLEECVIPRHQIAIMGDADTDTKKRALFEKVRQGEPVPEGGEAVARLAEKIKTLRASNEVEAALVRVGTRKATRAETPVTAEDSGAEGGTGG